MSRLTGSILIVVAAICWGLTGLFNRSLAVYGLSAEQVLLVRCLVPCVLLGIYALLFNRAAFRVRLADFWVFLGGGLLSLTLFGISYMNAMRVMDLSVAVVLLYTSPIWVVGLSAVLFKERLGKAKVLALALVAMGAVLATGMLAGDARVTPLGLLLGLVSGFGYGLYSIFTRLAYNRGYGPVTVTFYFFLFASLASALLADIPGFAQLAGMRFAAGEGFQMVGWGLAMGIVTALVPYVLYTLGLQGVENGPASVLATMEIVVSSLVSVLVYGEAFTWLSLAGIALVIAGIAVMNLGSARTA